MAAGCEATLLHWGVAPELISGWVNVPEGSFPTLHHLHLHPARPQGINEPTDAAVEGTIEILRRASQLAPSDLCIVLLSGGGSALLPAPVPGISLQDKIAVTRFLSRSGADITELNRVRAAISQIKGGGLARACSADHLLVLVLSDVLGDPLDVIASGPCIATTSNSTSALEILQRFDPDRQLPPSVYHVLNDQRRRTAEELELGERKRIEHVVIGNNAVAVDQAGAEAERRGWRMAMVSARETEGSAEGVGRHLAEMAIEMIRNVDGDGPNCLISGGEPTVTLPPSGSGTGGRNQQLVLAAIDHLLGPLQATDSELNRLCLLSGGTDGEDGPTTAAGGCIDGTILTSMRHESNSIQQQLRDCNAYPFLKQHGGLLVTGPTGTNVCDLRVVLVGDG
jgi:glycerate-2-kinase